MTQLNNENFNFTYDKYHLHKYNNISSYKYSHCQPFINIFFSDNIKTLENEISYYFIFDCPGADAFAHWVYESFLFLPLYKLLKKEYSQLKICTSNKKKYVKNLFQFFNIVDEIYTEIQTENNVCFFPHIFSLNDNNINQCLFTDLTLQFKKFIEDNTINFFKGKILLLPRNNKENYIDRIIYGIDDIEKNVLDIGGSSLNTYLCNNFNYQFNILKNFNNIILDCGSSFFVNCIFLKEKNIIILDNYNWRFTIEQFTSLKILYDIINQNNKLNFVGSSNNYILFESIKNLLN